jgi:hypothetical protein
MFSFASMFIKKINLNTSVSIYVFRKYFGKDVNSVLLISSSIP